MGGGSWTNASTQTQYASYASRSASSTVDELFVKRAIADTLDPHGVTLRESRDSEDNPMSTPIIIGLDVTGSMGRIALHIAKEGLNDIMTSIFDRKPVECPHLMFMGIGDAASDRAPLQVSQFEADFRIVEQLSDLYVERGGGANDTESYDFPWYFAGMYTRHDHFDKRNSKGYLFTMGDECPPEKISGSAISKVMGDNDASSIDSDKSLELAEKLYHVFHLIIEEGSYARHYPSRVKDGWRQRLRNRAILVDDHTNLSQIIVSVIQVSEGADPQDVIDSWEDPKISESVRRALLD